MFKNPFSFTGRIRRTEYALSVLISCIALPLFIIGADNFGLGKIAVIFFLPIAWFYVAQSAKRCHDRGNSGWFQLIPLYYIILLFGAGDIGKNEYGESPK